MLSDPSLDTGPGLGGPNCRRDVRTSLGEGQDEVPTDQT